MHEHHFVQDVINTVKKHAAEEKFTKVVKIKLKIGKMSGYNPENIKFNFEVQSAGTVVEGAEIEIIEVEGRELGIDSFLVE